MNTPATPAVSWRALEAALDTMGRAPTLDALGDAAAPLATALGARLLALAKLVPAGSDLVLEFVTGVFPEGWRERYDAARLGATDPLGRELPAPGLALSFADVLARASPDAPVRRHYEAISAVAGEVLAFRSPWDVAAWLVLLAAPAPADALETAAQRRWAAEAFRDEALKRLSPRAPAPSLTARQRACLRSAALGRNSVQIAADLRLAPKTVDAYLAAAAERLGARNRVAAVTTALQWGLL